MPFAPVRPLLHTLRVNWRHRAIVLDLIRRDFRLRFLGSILGRYWNIIHPLAMITIYSVIFARVMKARIGTIEHPLDYTIYLCSALLPWSAFVDTVSRGSRVFLDNAHFIKKVAFPIDILLPVVAGTATVTFAIAYMIFFGACLWQGHGLSWTLLLIPVAYALQVLFALGIAMVLGVLNVFSRDVEQAIGIVFQVWFWLNPIIYTENNIPSAFRVMMKFNPYYYFVRLYHALAFEHTLPSERIWLACAVLALVSMLVGTQFLSRFKGDIPDEL